MNPSLDGPERKRGKLEFILKAWTIAGKQQVLHLWSTAMVRAFGFLVC